MKHHAERKAWSEVLFRCTVQKSGLTNFSVGLLLVRIKHFWCSNLGTSSRRHPFGGSFGLCCVTRLGCSGSYCEFSERTCIPESRGFTGYLMLVKHMGTFSSFLKCNWAFLLLLNQHLLMLWACCLCVFSLSADDSDVKKLCLSPSAWPAQLGLSVPGCTVLDIISGRAYRIWPCNWISYTLKSLKGCLTEDNQEANNPWWLPEMVKSRENRC